MHITVPSLRQALADLPDFRQAQRRRYEWLPILLLISIARLCGYSSQSLSLNGARTTATPGSSGLASPARALQANPRSIVSSTALTICGLKPYWRVGPRPGCRHGPVKPTCKALLLMARLYVPARKAAHRLRTCLPASRINWLWSWLKSASVIRATRSAKPMSYWPGWSCKAK